MRCAPLTGTAIILVEIKWPAWSLDGKQCKLSTFGWINSSGVSFWFVRACWTRQSFHMNTNCEADVAVCFLGTQVKGTFQQRGVQQLLFSLPSSLSLLWLLYLSHISFLSPNSIYVLYLLHLICGARHKETQCKRGRDKGRTGLTELGRQAEMENKWCKRVSEREIQRSTHTG